MPDIPENVWVRLPLPNGMVMTLTGRQAEMDEDDLDLIAQLVNGLARLTSDPDHPATPSAPRQAGANNGRKRRFRRRPKEMAQGLSHEEAQRLREAG